MRDARELCMKTTKMSKLCIVYRDRVGFRILREIGQKLWGPQLPTFFL